MSMDPWLAQVYGTNGGAAEDLEKIAQAEMVQQLAAQEGVDLSQLSPEQIAHLGQEVLGQGGEQGGEGEITEETYAQAQQILSNPEQHDPELVQQAQAVMEHVEQLQAGGGEGQVQGYEQGAQQFGDPSQAGQAQVAQGQPGQAEMAKVAEAQAKFEEADFLGRVMAHSFNQESEKIAAVHGPFKGFSHGRVAENVKHYAGRAADAVGRAGKAVSGKAQQAAGTAKLYGAGAKFHGAKALNAAGTHIKAHPAAYAAGAAGAAGLGAGYAAGHHTKEATVNAIEKAAMAQAAAILEQNGIDPATGAPAQAQPQIAPPAPAADPQVALGELVEKRAHQILRGLGYNI